MTKQTERTVVINIHLTKGLVAVLTAILLLLAALAFARWLAAPVAASGPETVEAATTATGRRKFYRTWDSVYPDEAPTTCAAGYHMASLWEILDVSNLEYDTVLGFPEDDSGWGPPTQRFGWVHTGWETATSTGVLGQDNCSAWSSRSGSHWGTRAGLSWQWGTSETIHVWSADRSPCNIRYPVWCVGD